MGIIDLAILGAIFVGFFGLIAYVAFYARSKDEDSP